MGGNVPYPIAVTTDLSATLPNLRPCCVLQVGGFRPSGDERAYFDGAAWLAPNEPRPSDVRGAPMALIAQLNLSSAPWRPEELRQYAALQVFLGAQWRDEAARDWRVITRASWHDLKLQADPPEPGTVPVGRPVHRTEGRWMPRWTSRTSAATRAPNSGVGRPKFSSPLNSTPPCCVTGSGKSRQTSPGTCCRLTMQLIPPWCTWDWRRSVALGF